MPRDLFSSSVVSPRPSARRAGVLPLSIAAHALVLAAAFVLPLLAESTLPRVPDRTIFVFPRPPAIPAYVVPRPAAAGRLPSATLAPGVVPSRTAPTEAPSGLPTVDVPSDMSGSGPSGAPLTTTEGVNGGDPFGLPIALPPPPPARTVPVGGQVTPPLKIVDVKPVYPAIARQAHVAGTVLIDASIDEEGRVVSARVSRSVPLLDQAALTAVRQWVFTPARLNGQPVGVSITVTVEFRLEH
jgi:protein TonB